MTNRLFVLLSILLTIAAWPRAALAQGDVSDAAIQKTEEMHDASLPGFIAHAFEHNPSIQAARAAWRAKVEKYRVATAYPDPQLMVTYFPRPIETRLGPQDWNASLSQMIPFPGKLSKSGEVASADAGMARLALDKTVRDVAVAITRSYHELLYIQEARRIAGLNAGLLDEMRKISESAYAQDRAAFVDVVKAQSQAGQLQYDVLLLKELEETEKARLNGLLNRPPDAPLPPLIPVKMRPLAYSIDALFELAETHQEEIKMAGLQVEKAEAKQELAGFQNLPDFKAGIFYAGIGHPDVANPSPDAGEDAFGVQFGVSIPIWFGKNSSRTEEARALTQSAKAMKTDQINRTRTRIRSVYFKLKNAERLVALYSNDLLPQAMKSVQTAETWFREGEGSFTDFVEIQKSAYNFQLALARASADYGKELAALEQLVGRNLTSFSPPEAQKLSEENGKGAGQ